MGRSKAEGGLGFRDIESFNQAFLAKKCWRFLTNPISLAARIVKEKYFKRGSFLEAKLGANPSQIWRSIWGAQGLFKEGLRWRVGNGHKINI